MIPDHYGVEHGGLSWEDGGSFLKPLRGAGWRDTKYFTCDMTGRIEVQRPTCCDVLIMKLLR